MARCGNCKAKMGCSCQKRKASDGKQCCVKCITVYEKKIKANKTMTSSNDTSTHPVILSVTAEQKD